MRPKEENQRAIDSLNQFYMPQFLQAQQISDSHANKLIGYLVTLSAGVAVAYPTIAQVILTEVAPSEVLLPVVLALIGTALGLLCSFTVYLNYGFLSASLQCELELKTNDADEYFDHETFYSHRKIRSKNREAWAKERDKYHSRQNWTYIVSFVFGGLSALFFIVSVVCFAVKLTSASPILPVPLHENTVSDVAPNPISPEQRTPAKS